MGSVVKRNEKLSEVNAESTGCSPNIASYLRVVELLAPRNGSIDPASLSAGSHRKIWWRCSHGHEWQAPVRTIVAGLTCPYCSGRIVTPELSLGSTHPELSKQWHSTRNGELTPQDVLARSSKGAWWRCSSGHEWEARIRNRAAGIGCPYCSGQRATETDNLAVRRPGIAAQWHPIKNGNLTPRDVKTKSNRKYWWRCKNGHEWQSSPAHRGSIDGCPACLNRVLTKENSLTVVAPEIASQWHPTKNGMTPPNEVISGSTQSAWWRCNKGHEWRSIIRNRTVQGLGCPFCSNKRVGTDNNLAVLQPELAAEWHPTLNGPLLPDRVVPGSNKVIWWKCTRGHEWRAAIASRWAGSGCPKCRPNVSRLELRIYAELAPLFGQANRQQKLWRKEFDIVFPNVHLCIEVDGFPWHAGKHDRDLEKLALCRRHGHQLIRVRERRLESIEGHVVIYDESRREDALPILKDIVRIALSCADVDTQTRQRLTDYLQSDAFIDNATYQSLIADLPGPGQEKSLAVTHPELAAQWNTGRNWPLTPIDVSAGSGMKVWWRCERGHEWRAYVYSRTIAGCPYCSNRLVTKENSLAALFPEVAAQWQPTKNSPLTPYNVVAGSARRVWWQCKKGHEWMREIERRTNGGRGCPYCAGRLLPKKH